MNLLASALYDPAVAVAKSIATLIAMTAIDTTNLRLAVTVPAHGKVHFRIRIPGNGATTLASILLGVLNGATVVGRVAPKWFPGTLSSATAIGFFEAEFTVSGQTPGAINYDLAYAVQVIVAATNLRYGGPNNATGNNAWGGVVFEAWDPQPLKLGLDGGVNVTQYGGAAGTFAGGRPEVNTTNWGGTAVATAVVLNAANIGADAITAAKIADNAIDAASIAAGAITSAKFAAGAIDAAAIGADAITAAKIANGAIDAATFAANALDAVWSTAARTLTAGTNIVLVKGTGVTGFNDLSAAQVNAEADTALLDAGVTPAVTGRIDVAVSTRLATAGYSAPDNVGIGVAAAAAAAAATDAAAIKLKTNGLTFTFAGLLDVHTVRINGAIVLGLGQAPPLHWHG